MNAERSQNQAEALLCSDCFRNHGLRLDALRVGKLDHEPCRHCGSVGGAKLTRRGIESLAHRFFVVGSLYKTDYGGAPIIELNNRRSSELDPNPYHSDDAALISAKIGIGFFYYGPPLWRLGQVEPLLALQTLEGRGPIITRILAEYPVTVLTSDQIFYRLRKSVGEPQAPSEYDSPPDALCGGGRLDTSDLPILYGSADLEVCVHECRVTVEDPAHVATLRAIRPLQLLDLTAVLEEHVSSFESLDMAVHMLFLAGNHAYPAARAIAAAAKTKGLDGIQFPSYFSLLRTGEAFLETTYGLSTRVFPGAAYRERQKLVPNIALFGRPIADGRVIIDCINRLYLRQAAYDLGFGPASP